LLLAHQHFAQVVYLAAIRPFRYLIVYPAMMQQGRELWSHSGDNAGRDSEARLAVDRAFGLRQLS
jgi:hypothetical protein